MSFEINRAIYSVTTFYKTASTKNRAKELITELSSDERQLLLSIIDKTFDPNTTDCRSLTGKLMTISTKDQTDSFIPIAHEKDADRSSCSKVMMNIWRAIKNLFRTRISDDRLIKKICKFTKKDALTKLNSAKQEVETFLLQPEKQRYESDSTDVLIRKARKVDYLDDDLAKDTFVDIADHPTKSINYFVDRYINTLDNEDKKELLDDFQGQYVTEKIIEEFFPTKPLTVNNLLSAIDTKGYETLSTPQKQLIGAFLRILDLG